MHSRIAITGKICSGKTTLANELTLHGYTKISFGDKVKEMCVEIFDMKYKNRKLIQTFAEKMKEIDENVWINFVIAKIKENPENKWVIDDVRFPNEYEKLKENGFKFVYLEIDDKLQLDRLQKTYGDLYTEHSERLSHISEQHIKNIGNISDFKFKSNFDNLSQILHLINEDTCNKDVYNEDYYTDDSS